MYMCTYNYSWYYNYNNYNIMYVNCRSSDHCMYALGFCTDTGKMNPSVRIPINFTYTALYTCTITHIM